MLPNWRNKSEEFISRNYSRIPLSQTRTVNENLFDLSDSTLRIGIFCTVLVNKNKVDCKLFFCTCLAKQVLLYINMSVANLMAIIFGDENISCNSSSTFHFDDTFHLFARNLWRWRPCDLDGSPAYSMSKQRLASPAGSPGPCVQLAHALKCHALVQPSFATKKDHRVASFCLDFPTYLIF